LQANAEMLSVARPHVDWASRALSLTPHVVYVTDRDGIVLYAAGNQAQMQELGLVPGYDWSERTMGTNGAGTAIAANQPVAVSGPEHYCSPFHDCTCMGAPLHAPDGSVIGAIDVSTSVADSNPERLIFAAHIAYVIDGELAYREQSRRVEAARVAAAEALRQNEERLQIMADALPVLISYVDADGCYRFNNAAYERWFGIPPDAVRGRHMRDVLGQDAWQALEDRVADALAGDAQSFEQHVPYRGAGMRDVHVDYVPHRAADGRVMGFYALIADVSERRRAEAALKESEERFRAFMDNTSASAWMKDEQGRYAYLNKPFEKHFQVRLDDWRGKTDFDVWPREIAEQFRRNDREVLRSGKPREVVEQTVSGNGSRRTWLTSKFPFRDKAGRTYVGGIGFDITEREELEREVLEIAALEQRRIGQELHDSVGQELTGLGLLADALAQRLSAESANVATLAEKVVQGIGRVRAQVRSLSHGLVPVEVDPEGLRAALEQLAASAQESCGCVCTFESASPLTVADPDLATHLFRIAQEAVSNALRHGQARHIRIALGAESGAVTLTVQDDGVGFDEPPRGVKGLGLRLMRYRAGVIGGSLSVTRSASGGTAVSCRVPRGGRT
jgi:PAS domain S-box-containing protein